MLLVLFIINLLNHSLMGYAKLLLVLGFVGILVGSSAAIVVGASVVEERAIASNVASATSISDSSDTVAFDISTVSNIVTYTIGTKYCYVMTLNGKEHYCEVAVAIRLRAAIVGNKSTKFNVVTNDDGETEIVLAD